MKNIILFVAILFCYGTTWSQQKNVQSAYNYLGWGELDKAKEAIDLAVLHEQTMGKAKTWYYSGMVYQALNDSKDEKYKTLHATPLQVAYESYKKAIELDVDKQYSDDMYRRLLVAGNQMINKGVADFNAKDFGSALSSFETAVSISRLPLINKLDTLAMYNAALASERIGNYEKAIGYYAELIKVKFGGAKTYFYLSKDYKAKGDTAKAFEIVQQGRVAYPNDNTLVIEEINFYLQSGKNKEAVERLKTAIGLAPENHNLYYALGTTYDQLGDVPNSETAYKQGLALAEKFLTENEKKYTDSKGTDSEAEAKENLDRMREDNFNILYNLGALYYNDGVNRIKIANEIKDLTKYGKEKKAAEDVMVKALPYLEKALALNPRDRNTLSSLKELYARMNDKVNYERINEMLKN